MTIKRILLSLSIPLTFLSCSKVIEVQETDLIAGTTALKTIANNESAIIGAYGGVAIEMDILLNATFSDEVKTAGEFYNAATTHEWKYTPTDVGIRDNFTAVNPQYRIVDRVNRVLEALPEAEARAAGDEGKRATLKGEALFLRAWAHFQLFRYYCGPYTPKGLAMPYLVSTSFEPQARIEMEPYFKQLIADITEAKTLLPSSLTEKNRATVLSANGLHARIALYMEDWVAAETHSTAFINALPLATMAQFPGIWTDANTAEVAFQIVRNTGTRIGSLFRGTSASTTNIGTVTWKPTDKIWNSYDQVNDIRFKSYFKDEPLLAAANPPRQTRLIAKYAGTTYATTTENVNNAKVFRTGEMYLIRAEARAEQNKFTGANSAESDINALRAARIIGYTNVTFASKAEAIDAIMLERFKELAYEGHRFWDLKRRRLPVTRILAEAPTPTSATLAAGDYHFLLPIPETELQANSAMVQNPGYN